MKLNSSLPYTDSIWQSQYLGLVFSREFKISVAYLQFAPFWASKWEITITIGGIENRTRWRKLFATLKLFFTKAKLLANGHETTWKTRWGQKTR
jgi:hypothetical protein